jgi:anti-sigma factor RsiW
MTDRGWGLSEQHLMPDAVVAFVDGELTPTAWDRASAHVAKCPYCAAEVAAQRQARAAVQEANNLAAPDWLLASLRAIPQNVEVPTAPDGLAMTDDGQLVAVQRPDRVTALGGSAPLGSSPKLGEGRAVLGWRFGKRTAQGAGVVVSGLVLGALALANSGSSPSATPRETPPNDVRPATLGTHVDVVPVGMIAAVEHAPIGLAGR